MQATIEYIALDDHGLGVIEQRLLARSAEIDERFAQAGAASSPVVTRT
jgi:hypothetical protein